MKSSEAINELAGALSKAQGKIQGAHKDKTNTYYDSKYADLASVWDACREPLSENGLAVVQSFSDEILEYQGFDKEGKEVTLSYARVTVLTRLIHSSGQWFETSAVSESRDAGPQAIGSVVTFMRRYQLQSLVGVAGEDDDGNAATKPPATNGHHKASVQRPPAATSEYAGFEGKLRSTVSSHPESYPTIADAWAALKPECERLGLSTAAAIKGCSDRDKFKALEEALEANISIPL